MIRRPPSSTLFPYTSSSDLAVLHFGLRYPERARSLVVAGCGYGSDDQPQFRRDAEELGRRIEEEGMAQFRSEEHTSELQSLTNLVCRLLLEKKKKQLKLTTD